MFCVDGLGVGLVATGAPTFRVRFRKDGTPEAPYSSLFRGTRGGGQAINLHSPLLPAQGPRMSKAHLVQDPPNSYSISARTWKQNHPEPKLQHFPVF